MLKKIYNELSFNLLIDTVDPVIIKSGKASTSGPDDNPVKTWRKGKEDPEPFIPGSSLKGVFRSHIEKVIRTFNEEFACLPYDTNSCGNKFQDRFNKEEWGKDERRRKIYPESAQVYKESCPVCKAFGSTFFKGRIAISDAYLKENTQAVLEERDGVAIDRFTGGVSSSALFQLEVVAKAQFVTKVVIQNFECWQMGMLAIIINDLEDELIQIGSCTSRGFGRIKGTVENLNVCLFRTLENAGQIWGLGRCLNNSSYGTLNEDFIELTSMPAETIDGIRKKYVFTGDMLTNLKKAAIEKFMHKMSTWTVPDKMRNRGN